VRLGHGMRLRSHARSGCDDFNPCTTNACDPVAFCVYPPEPATTSCDDGLGCTTPDHCDGGGTCVGTSVCDDGNPCTDDFADEGNSCACSHAAAADERLAATTTPAPMRTLAPPAPALAALRTIATTTTPAPTTPATRPWVASTPRSRATTTTCATALRPAIRRPAVSPARLWPATTAMLATVSRPATP
jgi:hypothetical protein